MCLLVHRRWVFAVVYICIYMSIYVCIYMCLPVHRRLGFAVVYMLNISISLYICIYKPYLTYLHPSHLPSHPTPSLPTPQISTKTSQPQPLQGHGGVLRFHLPRRGQGPVTQQEQEEFVLSGCVSLLPPPSLHTPIHYIYASHLYIVCIAPYTLPFLFPYTCPSPMCVFNISLMPTYLPTYLPTYPPTNNLPSTNTLSTNNLPIH